MKIAVTGASGALYAVRTIAALLEQGCRLDLVVTDYGHGISPEALPRIFDPYFSTKKTGSGLGLATVYSIVKKHQGHVQVESTPGRGATFTLWLPAADSDAPVPAPSPAPAVADVVHLAPGAPRSPPRPGRGRSCGGGTR